MPGPFNGDFDDQAFEARNGDFVASIVRRFAVPDNHDAVQSAEQAVAYALAAAASGAIPVLLFFEPELYRKRAQDAGLSTIGPDASLIGHWLEHGVPARIVPTVLFDEQNYRRAYPDIGALPLLNFLHFLGFGLYEGRQPNLWFDAAWYRNEAMALSGSPPICAALPPYLHYLLIGTGQRAAPNALLRRLLDRDRSSDLDADLFRHLLSAAEAARLPLSASALDLTVSMFVPDFYRHATGMEPNVSDVATLIDFLAEGVGRGTAPTPLFDPPLYCRQAAAAGLPPIAPTPFLHWLQHGVPAGISPTALLDENHYRTTCLDVGFPGGYQHFAAHGVYEGRSPHVFFDTKWYAWLNTRDKPAATVEGRAPLPPYLHYLIFGLAARLPPSSELAPYLNEESRPDFGSDEFGALVQAVATLSMQLSTAELDIIFSLFAPDYYRFVAGLEDGTPDLAALTAFFVEGLQRGLSPTPLFDAAEYVERAKAAGLPALRAGEPPFLHWLRNGVPAEIIPTKSFDLEFYDGSNPNIGFKGLGLYLHFGRNGIYEGRRATAQAMAAVAVGYSRHAGARRPLPDNYRALFGMPPIDGSLGRSAALLASQRVAALVGSADFQEIVRRAAANDPAVGSVETIRDFSVPPLQDPAYSFEQEFRRRLPRLHYATVVCIPWSRMGGADLVAALISKSLATAGPDDPMLLLVTDHKHIEWRHWFPGEVDIVSVSDLFQHSFDPEALFLQILMAIGPKRVVNVNSQLCWAVFERFGRQLAQSIDLYASLFCFDLNKHGERVGYASRYFTSTFAHLRMVMTDTESFRSELVETYAVPPAASDRIRVLHTSARLPPRSPTAAEAGVASSRERGRPLILWAGRLDRQKRFDLVIATARAMPEADFRCWGAAVMDDAPDLRDQPENLTVCAPFTSRDELPLDASDAWLYTSAWDGLPTMLIELGVAGVPVAASAVGGVPELIDDTTGWPVHDLDNPAAYVAALREMIASPEERVIRAGRLQERAWARHRPETFDRRLADIMGIKIKSAEPMGFGPAA